MLVIFDLDGTILDTLADLLDAMNAALQHFGYPGHTLSEMRSYIGNGLRMMAVRAVPEGTPDEEIEKVYRFFKQYYAGHLDIKTAPYAGVRELLERLRGAGIHTAVSTNKFDPGAQALIKRHFGQLIEFTLGETEGIPRKPDPAGPRRIMEHFGAAAEGTVYVGDSTVDIQTARNINAASIAVTWGFQDEEKLAAYGAPLIVHSINELENALFALNKEI